MVTKLPAAMFATAACLCFFLTVPLVTGQQSGGAYEEDLVTDLPGAPPHSFRQYSGYITVDEAHGKALFYWLAEADVASPSQKPLVLWLNGGPGCSSVGGGVMSELGPFHPNPAGTLSTNPYSWNREANILFVESPVGVGFSYSNNTRDYMIGDYQTAFDTYTFLLVWLRRFPHYIGRPFYVAGESYAGHYVPQLVTRILQRQGSDDPRIPLKGFAVGNAWTDPASDNRGTVDFWWGRALISDMTKESLYKYCNFSTDFSQHTDVVQCYYATQVATQEMGDINLYGIYEDVCRSAAQLHETQRFLEHRRFLRPQHPLALRSSGVSRDGYDACLDNEVEAYLNRKDVQLAIHARTDLPRRWSDCSTVLRYSPTDDSNSMLPLYRELVGAPLKIWVFSGDVDGVVPVTGTRRWIRQLADERFLNPTRKWAPWYLNSQVGGHVEEYNSGRFVFATIRNAGHMVPYMQPARALALFQGFLGKSSPVMLGDGEARKPRPRAGRTSAIEAL